jgi:hypothetical protein
MGKNKIADSIIIRVGGGIREVRREPLVVEVADPSLGEAAFEQVDDMHPFGFEHGSTVGLGPDKIIK